jgi:hypothetical protein
MDKDQRGYVKRKWTIVMKVRLFLSSSRVRGEVRGLTGGADVDVDIARGSDMEPADSSSFGCSMLMVVSGLFKVSQSRLDPMQSISMKIAPQQ